MCLGGDDEGGRRKIGRVIVGLDRDAGVRQDRRQFGRGNEVEKKALVHLERLDICWESFGLSKGLGPVYLKAWVEIDGEN